MASHFLILKPDTSLCNEFSQSELVFITKKNMKFERLSIVNVVIHICLFGICCSGQLGFCNIFNRASASGHSSVYEAINSLQLSQNNRRVPPRIAIGEPEDFRRVSSIIDVDILPSSQRRVRLMKNGSDRPLGFYIRDGMSIHVTANGLGRVPGIFISRLVPGGLAESTGLLAVNDEVLEVNGIEVAGKTLDQVCQLVRLLLKLLCVV